MQLVHLRIEEQYSRNVKIEDAGYFPDDFLQHRLRLQGLIDRGRHVVKRGKLPSPLSDLFLQRRMRSLQLSRHTVEFVRQRLDLVSRFDLYLMIQITAPYEFDAAVQLLNRLRYSVRAPNNHDRPDRQTDAHTQQCESPHHFYIRESQIQRLLENDCPAQPAQRRVGTQHRCAKNSTRVIGWSRIPRERVTEEFLNFMDMAEIGPS